MLDRLADLVGKIKGQSFAGEVNYLDVYRKNDTWLASVEGGGSGELLSTPYSNHVALRWYLPGGTDFPRHYHPYEETMIIERGEVLFEGRTLKDGDWITVPAQKSHAVTSIEDTTFIVLWDANCLRLHDDGQGVNATTDE